MTSVAPNSSQSSLSFTASSSRAIRRELVFSQMRRAIGAASMTELPMFTPDVRARRNHTKGLGGQHHKRHLPLRSAPPARTLAGRVGIVPAGESNALSVFAKKPQATPSHPQHPKRPGSGQLRSQAFHSPYPYALLGAPLSALFRMPYARGSSCEAQRAAIRPLAKASATLPPVL